jgi:carboxymethylenebutenolidase
MIDKLRRSACRREDQQGGAALAETITFKRPDGADAPGWYDGPANAPGVVLIQEWWGLNDQIKGIGQKLTGLGYRVMIPDLYRGRVAVEAAEASHLMDGLDFADAAKQDVCGAARYLKGNGSARVAVMGYCMGGAVALLAAITVPEVDAAVPFYGAPPGMAEQSRNVGIPVLGHFALKDGFFAPSMVREFETNMKQSPAAASVTFHFYDAGHAFANEEGAAYNADAAALAWDRSVEFLAANLK